MATVNVKIGKQPLPELPRCTKCKDQIQSWNDPRKGTGECRSCFYSREASDAISAGNPVLCIYEELCQYAHYNRFGQSNVPTKQEKKLLWEKAKEIAARQP